MLREGGASSIPEKCKIDREAAAYWIAYIKQGDDS
jgi:hypothetical protein